MERRCVLGVLRPQDILILLKLLPWGQNWTFDQIAHELGFSSSAVHRSIDRATRSGLFNRAWKEVDRPSLTEFLVHGLRYVFPAESEGEARGVPTAWAAPPLSERVSQSGIPPVWPDAHGRVFGVSLKPLDPRVPEAARRDQPLGELLALVDAIRIGGARERGLAAELLEDRLRA